MSLQSELRQHHHAGGFVSVGYSSGRGSKRTFISNYGGIYNVATVTIYNPFLFPHLIAIRSQASSCEITNIWRFIYAQAVMINCSSTGLWTKKIKKKMENFAKYPRTHTQTHTGSPNGMLRYK